jgi:hypothetical protein
MREFDLKTTKVGSLKNAEIKELKEFLATRPFKEVKKFCLKVLDEETTLGEPTPCTKKVEKFLQDPQFEPVKKKVMAAIDDEEKGVDYGAVNEKESERAKRAKKQDEEMIQNAWKLN